MRPPAYETGDLPTDLSRQTRTIAARQASDGRESVPRVIWEKRMVQEMLVLREAGVRDFETAWERARRLVGGNKVGRRESYPGNGHDPDWLPFPAFFKLACEREWLGLVSVDYIGLPLLLQASDEPTPRALRSKRSRAPARHHVGERARS